MNVIALKLITGEDVLGEVIDTGSVETITLLNPVGIAVVRGPDGGPNIGFAPFPIHAEQKTGNKITFENKNIVYSYEPAEDFVTNYDKIFGAGIIVPNSQIITG